MPPSHRDTARALPPIGLHMYSKHVHTHALTHVHMGPSTYFTCACVVCTNAFTCAHIYMCVHVCLHSHMCVHT